jgi:hypothetical protein
VRDQSLHLGLLGLRLEQGDRFSDQDVRHLRNRSRRSI